MQLYACAVLTETPPVPVKKTKQQSYFSFDKLIFPFIGLDMPSQASLDKGTHTYPAKNIKCSFICTHAHCKPLHVDYTTQDCRIFFLYLQEVVFFQTGTPFRSLQTEYSKSSFCDSFFFFFFFFVMPV